MNEAFRQIPDWELLLEQNEHLALDEGAFTRVFLRHKNLPKWLSAALYTFQPMARRAEFIEAYSTPGGKIPWHDGSRNFPRVWFWITCVVTPRVSTLHT